MNPINVMVNGLPGNVSQTVAAQILQDERFELMPYSLTGPEIQEAEYSHCLLYTSDAADECVNV